jgi:class 3 adenylate cyclase
MAIWGAPREQPNHADLAVAAADDMMRWLETGNATWKQRFGVTIQLAIGIHTGEAVVGNIGSERRMDYTAIGEMVNIAARLESIARPGQILTTSQTREAAGEVYDYLEVGEHRLSERGKPLMLYEVEV